jgi:LacI family transcriptional regulator
LPNGLEKEVREVIASDIPVVLFDRYIPGLESDYVLIDNEKSAADATRHLIDNGYNEIAFVTIETDQSQMLDRTKGYERAVGSAGLKSIIKKINYQGKQGSVTEIAQFLRENSQIDATVFACNYLSMDGLDAIRQLNLKIGQDIAMVSFDDLEVLKYFMPSITAVAQPLEEIADQIMEILMYRLTANIDKNKIKTVLATQLEIRDSSQLKLPSQHVHFKTAVGIRQD